MKTTNFDLRIDKEQAIAFLKHNIFNDDNLGVIMCKEYGEDDNWVGITKDDVETIEEFEEYQTFEIWFA